MEHRLADLRASGDGGGRVVAQAATATVDRQSGGAPDKALLFRGLKQNRFPRIPWAAGATRARRSGAQYQLHREAPAGAADPEAAEPGKF